MAVWERAGISDVWEDVCRNADAAAGCSEAYTVGPGSYVMLRKPGYLIVDHRASPGIPAGLARRAGYDPLLCSEGKTFEADTQTCSHCKVVVVMNPDRVRARAHCVYCNHYVCDLCAIKMKEPEYRHVPFEKLVNIAKDCEAKGVEFDPKKVL
jgi:hypothetical protein